jgi:myosin heavy subunit
MDAKLKREITKQTNNDLSFMTEVSKIRDGPAAERIIEYQTAIIQQITNLDHDLDSVLKRQEQDFLNAFKYELFKLHSQIKELKKAANNKEIIIKHQEEVANLHKTIENLKSESFHYEELAEELKKEAKILKTKNLSLEKELKDLTVKLKQAKKTLKAQNSESFKSKERSSDIELPETSSSIKIINSYKPNSKSGHVIQELLQHYQEINENFLKDVEVLMERQSRSFEEATSHFKSVIKSEKRKHLSNSLAGSQMLYQQNELENLFLECVEEVRKEVLARRAQSLAFQKYTTKLLPFPKEKEQIFTSADKRKVMELLVSNEKVLILLYETLFPFRASQYPPRKDRSVRQAKSQEELPPISLQTLRQML